ncbi:unnamed protein product [Rhizophagus irregularis]|nr:unnamed protein product [Rhizophagus irregularis]
MMDSDQESTSSSSSSSSTYSSSSLSDNAIHLESKYKEVFIWVDSELKNIYEIDSERTWLEQKETIITKLLPRLYKLVNKKYNVSNSDILKDVTWTLAFTPPLKKKKSSSGKLLIENNDKYIRRYPEKELVRILKESGYHSEEWEETDSDEENDIIGEESAVKEKTMSTLEIGSGVDTDIPGIRPSVDADIPGNRLQRGRRYSRNSGYRFRREYRIPKVRKKPRFIRVGFRRSENQDSSGDFRRIDEPRFVSASRWIYRIRLSVLGFGYMEFGFRFRLSLGFRYMDFFRFLGVGYIGFDFGSWALNIRISAFDYWALDIWVSSFDYWALIYGFRLSFSGFRYVGFDFRLGFGYMGKFPLRIFGWIFLWTSIEWVSLSYFVR